jgi:circadian clock protein KaiB
MDPEAPEWLLFIRGQGARSLEALRAVRKASASAPGGPLAVLVIDVFREPSLAQEHGVVATPTLLTRHAGGEARLVGDVCDETVRRHLGEQRLGS